MYNSLTDYGINIIKRNSSIRIAINRGGKMNEMFNITASSLNFSQGLMFYRQVTGK